MKTAGTAVIRPAAASAACWPRAPASRQGTLADPSPPLTTAGNGKSDPYAVVQAPGAKKKRTRVARSTLNPVWAESLEVRVADAEAPLLLKVWDHDKLGMDDLLGQGEISLQQCPPHVRTPHTIALGKQGAVVQVEVTWHPDGAAAANKDKGA